METAELAIDNSYLVEESELENTRWYDYHNMNPETATSVFANAYAAIYKEFYGKVFDLYTATEAEPFPKGKASEWAALWQARQCADRIGCKYEFFLRTAFWRFVSRGYNTLPRPNQLYAEEIELDIKDAWFDRRNSEIQYATHPCFLASHYVASPVQIRYIDDLIKQIKRKSQPYLSLGTAVFAKRQIPLEIVLQHFDVETLKRAEVSSL